MARRLHRVEEAEHLQTRRATVDPETLHRPHRSRSVAAEDELQLHDETLTLEGHPISIKNALAVAFLIVTFLITLWTWAFLERIPWAT